MVGPGGDRVLRNGSGKSGDEVKQHNSNGREGNVRKSVKLPWC